MFVAKTRENGEGGLCFQKLGSVLGKFESVLSEV